MSKPKAPASPDYAAAATAQGAENLKAAQFEGGINRPDEVGVEGSRQWSIRPGADPKNPQPGDYVVTTTLSPEQQQLYQSGTDISQNFLNTAEQGLDRVGGALAQPFSLNDYGPMSRVEAGGLPVQSVGTQNLQTQIDSSGLAALPTDAAATRNAVTQAIIERARPEMDRSAQAARTRSIVAGGDAGSEGYKNTDDAIARAENDLTLGAISQGDQAAQREIANQLAIRGQGFGEKTTEAGFGNEALQAMFGQAMQSGAFANEADLSNFAKMMQSTGLDNQNRTQAIQEALMGRNIPINEINALRTGNQVSMPQFQPYWTGANVAAAPTFDASMAQGSYDLNRYGTKLSGYNAMMNNLTKLAQTGFAGMFGGG